ncbi:MAG: hypothetical protein KJO35_09460 [Gammaproteobacteria bacterium]|nr:hypothetical protein [Gammaproteobacteria bacterium]
MVLLLLPLVAAAEISTVDVEKDGARYRVAGEVTVSASSNAVLRMLTDYDALEKLDKGIVESRLIERLSADVSMVYTKLSGCIMFFCRKIERIERVQQLSDKELLAEVMHEESSKIGYEFSRWELQDSEQGTRILFNSQIEPDFFVPMLIGPVMIKSALRRRVGDTLAGLEDVARTYE